MTITADVREHGILMSGPMVLATLEDRKTKTRRVVTDRTSKGNFKASELDLSRAWVDPGLGGGQYLKSFLKPDVAERLGHGPDDVIERLYPRYRLGDRLWVRETLRQYDDNAWYYDADGAPIELDADDWRASAMRSWAYHVDREVCVSIHMPRWASRLTLEITGIRVERVQEISEEDAIDEGMMTLSRDWVLKSFPDYAAAVAEGRKKPPIGPGPRARFTVLWDQLNGKRSPWAKNDWVFVFEFRRIV